MSVSKSAVALLCVALAGCSSNGQAWWSSDKDAAASKPAAAQEVRTVQRTNPAWLDAAEARLRPALDGTRFRLERREESLVVIAPIEGTFNPDRPAMLLAASLGPITRVAKLTAADATAAVLVLGQNDHLNPELKMSTLGTERAAGIASLFRLSGLGADRLRSRSLPFASNPVPAVDAKGRVKDRHVEILVMPRERLEAHLLAYAGSTY